jgi:hypothetical protein
MVIRRAAVQNAGHMAAARPASEPTILREAVLFEEGDFHALSDRLAGDPQFNDRRLLARRKLLTLGKALVERAGERGLALECRTSLHNPNQFNGMRVKRLWAYAIRAKAAKRKLKAELGPELGSDLDAAYRNAYLCIALEPDCVEVSLRLHPDGWYDGQNLMNRLKKEGLEPWMKLLNELPGFFLRLHDWKGDWRCGVLDVAKLQEFLRYYKPGEHRIVVERRFPAPPGARGAVFEPSAPALVVDEALKLLPLYRYTAWSDESDFLFAR